jgi:hypothetical protein
METETHCVLNVSFVLLGRFEIRFATALWLLDDTVTRGWEILE